MGVDRHNLNIPELYAMYQRGWSIRALGRLVGIDAQTISARFRRENRPIEPFRYKIGPKFLAHCFAQGLSQRAVARKLGVSFQVIWRKVQHYRRLGLLDPNLATKKRREK